MSTVMIKNARLSFAALFEHETYMGESTGKFGCTLLIPKESQMAKQIESAVNAFAEEKWGAGKVPKNFNSPLSDGDDKSFDGYAGQLAIRTSTTRRPIVIDQRKITLTKEDERIFSGDYVNAKVSLWFQDNKFGKRVSCNLDAIQLFKQGERFGRGAASVDDFDEYEDDF